MDTLKKNMREIPGLQGKYFATYDGEIYSIKNHIHDGIFLKKTNANGYYVVSICVNGSVRNTGVHRLVAMAWIPNPQNKPETNHKDLNRKNNNVENLEWVTRSENLKHAWDTGAMYATKSKRKASSINLTKSNMKRRRLTMKQANKIRAIYKTKKISMEKIGKLYGLSEGSIRQIIYYETYTK